MRESHRRLSPNLRLYAAIDKLNLYESKLIAFNELPYPICAERLRMYYNRTGHNTIRAHEVVDGIIIVRVE